jgi:hypothetical protein
MIAGDKTTFPYEPVLADPAEKVYKGVASILAYRKHNVPTGEV